MVKYFKKFGSNELMYLDEFELNTEGDLTYEKLIQR